MSAEFDWTTPQQAAGYQNPAWRRWRRGNDV